MNPPVAITKCAEYDPGLVLDAVRKSAQLAGGLSKYIKPNSRVLVKPNLLMASLPEAGVTTHPQVLSAVIKLLKETGCKVVVGDGPSVWGGHIENVDDVYRITGTSRVCEEEGVELVRFDKRRMRRKFPLTTCLDECDYLVNIPKLKTHNLTLLTGAVKNLFGLVSGTFKTELHKDYFHADKFSGILVDILEEARPAFTFVDAIVALEGDGPGTSGKPRNLGLVLAGPDCVALDSVMAAIMGVRPDDVLTTKEAARRGLGRMDLASIDVLGESLKNLAVRPFILPQTSVVDKIPRPLAGLAKKLIKYKPVVRREVCIRCSACVAGCPKKVITMTPKGIVFDYSGCISCFCCQEVCPAAAIKVRKSLFARLIGL